MSYTFIYIQLVAFNTQKKCIREKISLFVLTKARKEKKCSKIILFWVLGRKEKMKEESDDMKEPAIKIHAIYCEFHYLHERGGIIKELSFKTIQFP